MTKDEIKRVREHIKYLEGCIRDNRKTMESRKATDSAKVQASNRWSRLHNELAEYRAMLKNA